MASAARSVKARSASGSLRPAGKFEGENGGGLGGIVVTLLGKSDRSTASIHSRGIETSPSMQAVHNPDSATQSSSKFYGLLRGQSWPGPRFGATSPRTIRPIPFPRQAARSANAEGIARADPLEN